MVSTFGEWLQAALSARGMDRSRLISELEAGGTTVSRQAVWAWANNHSRPNSSHLAALTRALELCEAEESRMLRLATLPSEAA